MPLLKIQTSVKEIENSLFILRKLSSEIAQIIGKPESYIMTSMENSIDMTFAGSEEPSCYVEVKSIGGLDSDNIKSISESICNILQKEIGVASNRTYIYFEDVQPHLWGWDKRTFG